MAPPEHDCPKKQRRWIKLWQAACFSHNPFHSNTSSSKPEIRKKHPEYNSPKRRGGQSATPPSLCSSTAVHTGCFWLMGSLNTEISNSKRCFIEDGDVSQCLELCLYTFWKLGWAFNNEWCAVDVVGKSCDTQVATSSQYSRRKTVCTIHLPFRSQNTTSYQQPSPKKPSYCLQVKKFLPRLYFRKISQIVQMAHFDISFCQSPSRFFICAYHNG